MPTPNPYQLLTGDNLQHLKQIADNSIDAVVTDPPYGIEFLGKDWDKNTGAVETWRECLRVLKPGGHLLAFSAARTYHHLATNIESVGFEIRDQIMWIYSSGFPKAQDIGKALDKRAGKTDPKFKGTDSFNLTFGQTPGQRVCAVCKKDQTAVYQCDRVDCGQKYSAQTPQGQQWHGWKTALKPGHEPIVMARKPFKGSTIDNIQQHGVGALNIDATRIAFEDQADLTEFKSGFQHENLVKTGGPTFQGSDAKPKTKTPSGGVDGFSRLEFGQREPIKYKDQKRVIRAGRHPGARLGDLESQTTPADHDHEATPVYEPNVNGRYPSNVLGEIPDYQKYFYCPKVRRRERHCGFEQDNLPKRLMPMPGPNGQKDIRDCLDKDWANKKDTLAHIPTNPNAKGMKTAYNDKDYRFKEPSFDALTDSAPKGSRRCSKDSHERWHQGMAHKKGHTADPLAHIATMTNYQQGDVKNHPLWDPSIGTNIQRLKHKILEHNRDLGKKTDPLAHLPTESSMLAAVGGYYVDAAGNRTETKGKNIWTPTTGQVYVHGLTKIYEDWCQTHNQTTQVGNNHPTVKPVALMRYLIQLVTPNNSVVLDPFMGSGSTGMAACELGHTFVGIDQDPNYVQIAHKRIQGWTQRAEHTPGNLDHIPTDPSGMNYKDMDGPPGENYAQRKQRMKSTLKPPIKNTDLFDDLFE